LAADRASENGLTGRFRHPLLVGPATSFPLFVAAFRASLRRRRRTRLNFQETILFRVRQRR
jgi:hypothetical protein